MSELRFDIRGNLTPYELVEVPVAVFRETFVDSFEENSTRHGLWANFERYLAELRAQVGEPVRVWVNGSFITIRHDPDDMDIVVFLALKFYEKHEALIETRFRFPGSKLFYPGIDAYDVKIFPEEHPKHFFSRSDWAYWYDWFSKSRSNRFEKGYKKGFVQLKF